MTRPFPSIAPNLNKRKLLQMAAASVVLPGCASVKTSQPTSSGSGAASRAALPAELWRWDTVDVAHGVRAGWISSREVTQSVLDRIAAINPQINAVVDVMASEALAAADAADAARKRGDVLGPLHGVPMTIKTNVDVKGHANTNGIRAAANNIAPADGSVALNARNAGAVIVGITNTPSFSFRWFTDNVLHGRTLNPWDAGLTPGGSSGGAAAAVASGMGPLAHGNDIAGSVRYPAYACGVAGLRCTVGRIPTFNPTAKAGRGYGSLMMSVQGILSRRVGDLRLGLAALGKPDIRDSQSVDAPLELPGGGEPVRVALVMDMPGSGTKTHPAVKAALQESGRKLQAAGYVVEEYLPPHLDEAYALWLTIVMGEADLKMRPAVQQVGDRTVQLAFDGMMEPVPKVDFSKYLDAIARLAVLRNEWSLFFGKTPLILMPNSLELPFPIDADQQGNAAMRRIMDAQSPMMAISALSLPGLSVPTGVVQGHIPTGVQLVSAWMREDRLIAAGEVIERGVNMATPVDPVAKKAGSAG